MPCSAKGLIPKDEGIGVMLSAFFSCEFGFGMTLLEEELEAVNEHRRGKNCTDEDETSKINYSSLKKGLTQSPFVEELECNNSVSDKGH